MAMGAHASAGTDEASAARRAVERGDWSQALRDWQNLFIQGNAEAPRELCRLYFDGRDGGFDASKAIDWCRRAAAGGDAEGLYRMGLLYLVGLGVDRNIEQAQLMCATARGRTPRVPAGFCLTAVYREKRQAALDALGDLPAGSHADTPRQTDAGSPQQRCERAFMANAAPFDAAAVVTWCGQAAADDDADALHRVGLMNLTGLSGTVNFDAAASNCARAEARSDGRVSAAFCLAAVDQLHRATVSLALARDFGAIDSHPAVGLPVPKTTADPYLADRLLDASHKTPNGLRYTCRQISNWALFEMPGLSILEPRDQLFGRRITEYKPADFADLDRAAAHCADATASVDLQGSLQQSFSRFRTSLGGLAARQVDLIAAQRQSRAEAHEIELDQQVHKASLIVEPSILTPQESVCIEEVRQAWVTSRHGMPERATLEIRESHREVEDGNDVVRGRAGIVETATERREVNAISSFSCSFIGHSEKVATSVVVPELLLQSSGNGH